MEKHFLLMGEGFALVAVFYQWPLTSAGKKLKLKFCVKTNLVLPDLSEQEVTGWCEQRDCASQVMSLIHYSAKQPPESHGDRKLSDESGPAFAANLDCCLAGK